MCVWGILFFCKLHFSAGSRLQLDMLGGHGRWEDGAAGDVGRTKMGLQGAPSGARSRMSGILFGWSVCERADGFAVFQGFFCCEIF